MLDPKFLLASLRAQARDNSVDVAKISEHVIGRPEFAIWSGSSKPEQHHYGDGGLLRHTYEVVDLCLMNRKFFDGEGHDIPKDQLFLAALFHDIGKIRDYKRIEGADDMGGFAKYPDKWTSAPHKRTIHHISRSGIMWTQAVAETRCCQDIEDDVLHAILAHHGLREFGSPVFPKTKVAWLLHLCDQMSARMDDCDRWDLVHGNK